MSTKKKGRSAPDKKTAPGALADIEAQTFMLTSTESVAHITRRDADIKAMALELAQTRWAARSAYGHDVYEFGCPLCHRGSPHLEGCLFEKILAFKVQRP